MLDPGRVRAKNITRGRAGHYSMMKGSIHYENTIAIFNLYPAKAALQTVRQKQMEQKGEIDKSTVTAGDLNTPLSTFDINNIPAVSESAADTCSLSSNCSFCLVIFLLNARHDVLCKRN